MRPLEANRILQSVPAAARRTIARDLGRRHFQRGEVLAHVDEPVSGLYFPLAGVISLMAQADEETELEVAAVGSNGTFGSFLLLGDNASPWNAVAELDGEALVMEPATAQWHARESPEFARALHADSLRLMHALSLSGVCRAFHPLSQRLARSLLSMQEAAGAQDLATTHDFLARLLGVQRSSVTLSAGRLQLAGAVELRRGQVRVVDVRVLRSESCGCHDALLRHGERLLRADPRNDLRRDER